MNEHPSSDERLAALRAKAEYCLASRPSAPLLINPRELLAIVECAEALRRIRGHDDWSDAIAGPALDKLKAL